MTHYRVLRPFGWDGRDLVKGEVVDIPPDHPRIGPLTRAKFMRYEPDGGGKPPADKLQPGPSPKVQGTAQTKGQAPADQKPSPKEVVAAAKAKAAAERQSVG